MAQEAMMVIRFGLLFPLAVPLAVVIFILGGLLFYLLGDDGSEGVGEVLHKPVISFSPEDLYDSGISYDKSVFIGRVTIVNVFASWCVPCVAEHGFISRFKGEGGKGGFQVIGLNWRDSRGAAQDFLRRLGNPYDFVGYDSDGMTAIDWGVRGIPETYIVDSGGVIHYRYVGAILSDEVFDDIVRRAELLL